MALRDILKIPDKRLRLVSEPVKKIDDGAMDGFAVPHPPDACGDSRDAPVFQAPLPGVDALKSRDSHKQAKDCNESQPPLTLRWREGAATERQ